MKIFSFYHRETGALLPHRFSTDIDPDRNKGGLLRCLTANTPADHVAIEGQLDHLSQRVDLTGGKPTVVDWQPPAPSTDHQWDAPSKRWTLKPEAVARQAAARAARSRIHALEASQSRAVREAALGQAGAVERLQAIEAEIAGLRGQLALP